jgi:hypothetical protein
MNETQIAQQVREALDDSAERLPYRVSHRLQTARQAALARQRVNEIELVLSPALSGSTRLPGTEHPLWWRVGLTLLPVLVVAVGLLAISIWNETEMADEIAEIDNAVLTDDVPLSAYTDRGFGVFLKNSRQ